MTTLTAVHDPVVSLAAVRATVTLAFVVGLFIFSAPAWIFSEPDNSYYLGW